MRNGAWLTHLSASIGRDGRITVRRLLRAPWFAMATALTLTVGIGAFAVAYTAYHKVLIEPLPYERPEDLFFVWRDYTWVGFDRGWLGPTDVAELQRAGGVLQDAAGMLHMNMTIARSAESDPAEIPVISTSPNLFEILGVRPAFGRVFAPEEVGPGRPAVIVVTHTLWQRLGADPAIVGEDVLLNGSPWRVIGVLGPEFRFVRNASVGSAEPADAYIPLDLHLSEGDPNQGRYAGLVRVRPATRPETVDAAVSAVGALIDERDFHGQGLRLYATNVQQDLVAPARPALTVLALAALFLMLVLVVNLATLLLARAGQREREFAVARALGAHPLALARWAVLEGATLGLIGGIGAVVVAIWGTRLLVSLAPMDLPSREAITLDANIAVVVVAVGALVGAFAGAVPGIWAARTRLSSVVGIMGVRGAGARGRLRQGLVVIQLALSLVLLMAGGLVVRSFDQLLRIDPGFDAAGVLTVRVPVMGAANPGLAGIHALHDRIQTELAALPGVESVGAASGLPLTGAGVNQTPVSFPGAPGNTGDADEDTPLTDWMLVRAGFFETIGARVLAGRTFAGAPPSGVVEVVIDHTLARKFFPGADPVGATMTFAGSELVIIGVIEHLRLIDLHQDGLAQVFLRNDADGPTWGSLSWVLRTNRTLASVVPDVRAAVRRVDSRLPVSQVRTMDGIVADAVRQQRIVAVLIGGFSLGALLLAAMGLFGVIAGSVTRRRHELAVRLALGADHDRILRLVMKEGATLVLLGWVIGLPGAFVCGRLLHAALYGVEPSEPTMLAAVALGLALTAMAATYVPARRVVAIEPASSLRDE